MIPLFSGTRCSGLADCPAGWEFPTRALMLLHHFPPEENIAAFRFGRLLQHLPKLGVGPIVVSSARDGKPVCESTELPSGIHIPVTRVTGWDPIGSYQKRGNGDASPAATESRSKPWQQRAKRWVRSFMIPDDKFGYVSPWTKAARPLAANVDVLYSSSSPYSAHLAARRIARATQLPWVMEMRDLWADSPYLPARNKSLILKFHERLERRCMAEASRIIVLAPAHARHLSQRYPQHAAKIRVVTNMIDRPMSGPGAPPLRTSGPHSSGTQLVRLAYVGSLYGGRSLRTLVEALDRRNESHSDVRWHLDVAGASMDRRWSEVLGDSDAVTIHGRLSEDRVRQLLDSVQVGVVHNPAWDEVHIPGKLFDYLGSHLSILNLSSQPDIEEMVRDCVPVETACPDDTSAIGEALGRLLAALADGEDAAVPELGRAAGLERFSSLTVAGQLADVLHEAAGLAR